MKIELDQQSLSIIANALAQRPFGEVASVVADMQRQVDAHNAAQAAAAAAAAKPAPRKKKAAGQ